MVSGCAPSFWARRLISASPRVISAARELWPNSRPSQMPAAIATTFLRAPPISTPMTSSVLYTRKRWFVKASCAACVKALLRPATSTAVGMPAATSLAKLGPLKKVSCSSRSEGNTLSRICEGSWRVSFSMPLMAFTMGTSPGS
jgi:hypothetical protein